MATIGDVNKDQYRGHYPWERQPDWKSRDRSFLWPIPDVIVGCPQANSGVLPGRAFIWFMTKEGANQGYVLLPNTSDVLDGIAPDLKAKDQFGSSIAPYQDLDQNGIREIVFGAPGDHDMGYNTGALYIFFLRRKRYHPPFYDWRRYYCSIFIPIGVYCLLCWGGIRYFFWYFRRKPDEIEIMVKNSNIEITKTRKDHSRAKYDNKVHVDAYE